MRKQDRARLVGSVAHTLHGAFFLLLAIAAVIRFGPTFDLCGAAIAAISLLSLKQAWVGFREYYRR